MSAVGQPQCENQPSSVLPAVSDRNHRFASAAAEFSRRLCASRTQSRTIDSSL